MDIPYSNILITGARGFLGEHILSALETWGVSGERIRAPSSLELDLRVRKNCEKAVAGCDAVIHAAASTGSVSVHQKQPAQILYDNLVMGVQLMESARQAGVKQFITVGSATEYPERAPAPFRESDLWEGAVAPSHAPYALAKKMLLVQAQAYRAQYGMGGAHLLLASLYGPGGGMRDGGPIPSLIERIKTAKNEGRGSIEVWGTGKPRRDFVYAPDAASAILLALAHDRGAEPINIGTGIGISIDELASLIAELMDFHGEIRFDTSRPDGQLERVLDVSRAEQVLGFKAPTSLHEGLRQTIAWHLDLPSALQS